jgi:hypothetical protein
MKNFLDIALETAGQKGKNILAQDQAAQAEIENRYMPDKFAADIFLNQMQAKKIPYDIKNMQSEAAYRNMMGKAALMDAGTKQQQLNLQKKLLEMYMNPSAMGNMPGAGIPNLPTGMKLPGMGVLSPGKNQLPMYQIDPATGEQMARISTPQSKGQQTLYFNPTSSKVYGSLTTAMQNRVQKAAASMPQLIASMQELAPAIGPYLGAQGRIRYFMDKGRTMYTGKDIPALAKYEDAMDSIKTTAEQLMAVNYLNSTVEAFNEMKSTLMPRPHDNEYSYSRRILLHIQKEMMKQQRIHSTLGRGIELGTYGNFGGTPYGMPQQQGQQGGGMDDASLDQMLNGLE